jgi:oligo-1,6-glucosidase
MHRKVFTGRPPGLLNVGETPGCSVEEAVLYTDPSRGELDMVFQFEHVDLDSGPKGKWDVKPVRMLQLKQSLGRWQDGLAEVGWNSLYLGNHDQPRCVSRFGSDAPEHREQSAKALATVLHLHRGTPYVYQGDELGMSNPGFTRLDQLRDVESLNHYATAVARGENPADVMRALAYKGRDNARVPLPWDASPGAGFTTGTPWLDLHPRSRLRERRRAGRRPRLGLLALPPAHRAAARRALRRARDVPDAPGRPRAAVLLRTILRHHPAAGRGQPVVRS